MEIIPYSQLEGKHQLLPLCYHAGHGPLDPRAFEERARLDFRLRQEPRGLCAVEGGRLLGFVGLLEIPTRTVDGPRVVGGISNVVTHVNYVRRGICTALMEAAHRHFRERGFPFAFLTAFRGLRAYDLYRDLGYVEVDAVSRYPLAYSLVEAGAAPEEGEGLDAPSEDGVARLFSEFTAKATGFVIRPADYFSFVVWRKRIDPDLSVQADSSYALVRGWQGTIMISEMVAADHEVQAKLLRALEARSGGVVIDPAVTTVRLAEGYAASNYRLYNGRYDIVMAKPLEADVSLERAYGSDFYMSGLEWF
jgi:GNAT superfamily N-acetyltransferase